jgi:hypothetical protein
MINKIKYRIIILLVLASFTACQNDDMAPANIDAMVAEPGDLLNQAYPLNKVRVEGEGLTGLKRLRWTIKLISLSIQTIIQKKHLFLLSPLMKN